MKLYYEWGVRQMSKRGEELCGDSVVVFRHPNFVTVALSDGLGSGVQANILATLTTRIASHLLENELPLDEVVQTLTATLPVCTTRNLAYSTFAIGEFFTQGFARIVIFDSPPAVFLRGRRMRQVNSDTRTIEGKTIQECEVPLEIGDWVIFVSDGVLNAGIGGCYPLGWGWQKTASFLEQKAHPSLSAQDLADCTAQTVSELYADNVGDDVSVVVIKARQKETVTVLTGPPGDSSKLEGLLSRFVERHGHLAVCGGTTAKIVAKHLGRPVDVDLSTGTDKVPAKGRIEGIDLVTEGILTLTQVSELLREGADGNTVQFRVDGAADLIRLLLAADHIDFMVGLAVNPAHQNPDLPAQLGMKLSVVREIASELRKRDKEVSVEAA
ncbi:MAG: SpoIIE family protein phosphatase [Lentisphaerae bacterium]|nr:SpoIIE family protein phosphatase [Lentisphaerota bacterium]